MLELASFERFSATHEAFLGQLTESIGIVINPIEANTRTRGLLTQSQSLAQELQSRQQELQQTNQELEKKADLLAHQNQEVERKNEEVEQARKALEEKAEQLALINDILDLSKIESGTVVVEPAELMLDELRRYVERTFRHVAEAKNVDFFIRLDPKLPKSMFADPKRLQQVLKNLLSNSFKFTHEGHVTFAIGHAKSGWNPQNESLNRASDVIAFSVTDTGIGISPDKQQIIFEAFQQADGSTNRKYRGTGLGLAISRELSRLLGGEIRLVGAPRVGSTFTLYLPVTYAALRPARAGAMTMPAAHDVGAEKTTPSGSAKAGAPAELRIGDRAGADEAAHDRAGSLKSLPRLINEVGDDRDAVEPVDDVVLIVENDLASDDIRVYTARDHAMASELVRKHRVDCMVLDTPISRRWTKPRHTRKPTRTRRSIGCRSSSTGARRSRNPNP